MFYVSFGTLDTYQGCIKRVLCCLGNPIQVPQHKTLFARYDCFGDYSLNNSTPGDLYLGQPCVYTFPKIDDFRRMILRCGRGCFLFKRDLSRFFLQIPLDPVEYHRVGLIWRGLIFFFIGLAFGLRHSGPEADRCPVLDP